MKLNSYIIHDKQANSYNQPMFLANDAVAIRQIRNELMNPNSQISLSPEDFTIYSNGAYFTDSGEFHPYFDDMDEVTLKEIIKVSEIELPTQEVK